MCEHMIECGECMRACLSVYMHIYGCVSEPVCTHLCDSE